MNDVVIMWMNLATIHLLPYEIKPLSEIKSKEGNNEHKGLQF